MRIGMAEVLHALRSAVESLGDSYQQIEVVLPCKSYDRLAQRINDGPIFADRLVLGHRARGDEFTYYGMKIHRFDESLQSQVNTLKEEIERLKAENQELKDQWQYKESVDKFFDGAKESPKC